MTTVTSPKKPVSATAGTGFVDCDIHPRPKSMEDLKRFLPQRWREHHEIYGSYGRNLFAGGSTYPRMSPAAARRDAWPPGGGEPGSDLEFMQTQHLDPMAVSHGILVPMVPAGVKERNQGYGAALCRAQNMWQASEWLDRDSRLRGSILVTQDDPEAAVEEIRRCAQDKRFVRVQIWPRSIEPLGRKRYWPIYEAAVEHGLPVATHNGGYAGHSSHAGGWCTFYIEEHNALSLVANSMVTSLVAEGVLERFPMLKIVMVEMSFTWVPSLAARLDRLFKRYASEVPDLKKLPSEYIRENFYFTTQPMDAPVQGEHLRETMAAVGWDRLLFASDYPHWDQDDPNYAFPFAIEPAHKDQLLRRNAIELYGLD